MTTDRLLVRRFSEGMDVRAIAHRYGLAVARVEAAIRSEFHRKARA
jgi:Mor family transcriptional regulator